MRMGVFSFVKEDFNPHEALNFVQSMFTHKAEAKGIEIILSSEGLPRRLLGDERRFKQVLINLVKNSIKFTSDGFITVQAEYDFSN